MALPALQNFEDCASWAKTVEPYLPQLYELPSKLVDVVQGRQGLLDLYIHTNPLISGFAIAVILGAVFLVVAEINNNYSQVDRCWSVLPTFYIAHLDLWARLAGVPSSRIDALLVFSTAWSVSIYESASAEPSCADRAVDSLDIQLLAERRLQHRV